MTDRNRRSLGETLRDRWYVVLTVALISVGVLSPIVVRVYDKWKLGKYGGFHTTSTTPRYLEPCFGKHMTWLDGSEVIWLVHEGFCDTSDYNRGARMFYEEKGGSPEVTIRKGNGTTGLIWVRVVLPKCTIVFGSPNYEYSKVTAFLNPAISEVERLGGPVRTSGISDHLPGEPGQPSAS